MKLIHRITYSIKRLINRIMSSSYPMPAYHFNVDWGGTRTGFTEVSGLNITHELVEYREGNSPVDASIKIPGRTMFDNIILKRGIVKGDTDFLDWMKTKQNSLIQRRDIVISLLDETHAPIMVWKVHNAFPVKYSGPQLHSCSSEVAMESLEIAHEGLQVESP
jgi:phage tail-like protein